MYPRYSKAVTTPTSNCGVDSETQQELLQTGAYSSSTARSRTPTHRDPSYQQPAQESKRGRSTTRGSTRSPRNHKQGYYHHTTLVVMFLGLAVVLYIYFITFTNGNRDLYNNDKDELHVRQSNLCPDYKTYAARPHPPYTSGTYALPFQRPKLECRLFQSQAVENVIQELIGKIENPDLARLFENAYPNTLDTTVRWFTGSSAQDAQSFIVTGDINAQWLRDCEFGFMYRILLGVLNVASYKPAIAISTSCKRGPKVEDFNSRCYKYAGRRNFLTPPHLQS